MSDELSVIDEIDLIGEQSVDEMNLVDILAHGKNAEVKEENSKMRAEAQAQALTIKEECLEQLLTICSEVRGSPDGFLSFSVEHSAMISSDTDEPLVF